MYLILCKFSIPLREALLHGIMYLLFGSPFTQDYVSTVWKLFLHGIMYLDTVDTNSRT